MRILFCFDMPYLPAAINGACRSMDALVRNLQGSGHQPLVMVRSDSAVAVSGLTPDTPPLPYPTFHSARFNDDFPAVLQQWQPDIVFVRGLPEAGKTVEMLREKGVACVFFASLFIGQLLYPYYESPTVKHISLCRYGATNLKRLYNVGSTIIPPLIEVAAYKTENPGRDAILFVNPSLEKGIYCVLELARLMRHRRFIIIESWPIHPEWRAHLRNSAPPNIAWVEPCADLRPYYHQAKLVLAPSVWDEPWCRVVSEAQISGIPVLATRRGGLPESVGAGGLLFDLEADASHWALAIDALFNDASYYNALSGAALQHAQRDAIKKETIMNQWEAIIAEMAPLTKKSD